MVTETGGDGRGSGDAATTERVGEVATGFCGIMTKDGDNANGVGDGAGRGWESTGGGGEVA